VAKHDVQALRQRLRDVATQADLTDTQSMLQARNHTLREILLWEFGSDFRMDSQFLPMVDAIGTTLDAEPAFQQRFIDLITDLRKS
jgi:ketopantoate hydroxymethyltransferase